MKISYTVRITGHTPPFKWEIQRYGTNGTGVTPPAIGDLEPRGVAQTREQAMGDAYAVASDFEWHRRHGATIVEEDLFEYETDPRFESSAPPAQNFGLAATHVPQEPDSA
jgi:hypothetical protein